MPRKLITIQTVARHLSEAAMLTRYTDGGMRSVQSAKIDEDFRQLAALLGYSVVPLAEPVPETNPNDDAPWVVCPAALGAAGWAIRREKFAQFEVETRRSPPPLPVACAP